MPKHLYQYFKTALLCFALLAGVAVAEEVTIKHKLLVSGSRFNKIAIVSEEGKERCVYKQNGTFRQVRKTPQGTYLFAHGGKKAFGKEVDETGKIIREFPFGGFSSTRLKNGNTILVFYGNKTSNVVEITPDSKIVWTMPKIEGYGTISSIQVLDKEEMIGFIER